MENTVGDYNVKKKKFTVNLMKYHDTTTDINRGKLLKTQINDPTVQSCPKCLIRRGIAAESTYQMAECHFKSFYSKPDIYIIFLYIFLSAVLDRQSTWTWQVLSQVLFMFSLNIWFYLKNWKKLPCVYYCFSFSQSIMT